MKNGLDLHHLVRKYNFGDKAVLDTSYRAKILHRNVRTTISEYAVGESGKVSRRWPKLPTQTRGLMVEDLISRARWLSQFGDDWAAEWIHHKAVDQRVVDIQRKTGANARIRRALAKVSFPPPGSKCTPAGECLSK